MVQEAWGWLPVNGLQTLVGKVGLFDLNQQALDEAKSAVDGSAVMTGVLDVTSTASFTQAVSDFSNFSGGRMDLLFNNAGIAPGGLLEDMSGSHHQVDSRGQCHGRYPWNPGRATVTQGDR